MKAKRNKIVLLKIALISVIGIFILFLTLNFLFPVKDSVNFSQLITDKKGNVVHVFLNNEDKWRLKTDIEEISPKLEQAFLFKEDKYFYYHPGINLFAIVRAATNNLIKNKRTSGASTITMQVARMLSPKERSLRNKIIETFRAFQLEWKYSKKEILQLYFNMVPYGGNIEGVKSASVFYFDKLPDRLSLAEITTLTIIPNRPNSLMPGVDDQNLLAQRNKWLKRFGESGNFTGDEIEQALDEPMEGFRHAAPQFANQYSLRLKNNNPGVPLIKSTLDLGLQSRIQKMTKDYMAGMYSRHIYNASVLVINNQTMEVEAYIASNDFSDATHGGQMDGVIALRSPGSTLKPMLYAAAFDKGILTAKTVVNDVPANFSGYQPENYDGTFHGPVTVEYALANSLNMPVVNILENIGLPFFINKLADAGFESIVRQKENLGLSVILGGCGVTLEELTHQYSILANGGKLKGIKYRISDPVSTRKIISEESAYMTSQILIQLERPDLPYQWQQAANIPKIAWKTGTSYGRRDAWSIGYNRNYTVGVWVGNFSGEGVPEILGSEIAGPLLFNVFNALGKTSGEEWFLPPGKLDFRLVCEESGNIPNEYCGGLITDNYIPGITSMQKCEVHQEIFTDSRAEISYCTSCLPETGYKKEVFSIYSPEVISWQRLSQINFQTIPQHNTDCERIFAENAPKIVSPNPAEEYFIDKTDSTEIALHAQVSADVKKVFWYVNNTFLASALPEEPVFYFPPKGSVKISCTDDKGRNTDIDVQIKYVNF